MREKKNNNKKKTLVAHTIYWIGWMDGVCNKDMASNQWYDVKDLLFKTIINCHLDFGQCESGVHSLNSFSLKIYQSLWVLVFGLPFSLCFFLEEQIAWYVEFEVRAAFSLIEMAVHKNWICQMSVADASPAHLIKISTRWHWGSLFLFIFSSTCSRSLLISDHVIHIEWTVAFVNLQIMQISYEEGKKKQHFSALKFAFRVPVFYNINLYFTYERWKSDLHSD